MTILQRKTGERQFNLEHKTQNHPRCQHCNRQIITALQNAAIDTTPERDF